MVDRGAKMIEASTCAVCGEGVNEVFHVPAYPLQTTACRPEITVTMLPLAVGFCPRCSHVQLTQRPDEESLRRLYEGDYTSVVEKGTFATADQLAIDCRQFLEFAAAGHPRPGSRILEIGCFDGAFLSLFENCERMGCEPNPIGATARDRHGVRWIQNYFDAGDYPKGGLSLIVLRHIIEHVADPLRLLVDCRSLLSSDGLILLETPNVEHTLRQQVIGNFFHQHLHYFTRESLDILIRRSGLRPLAVAIKDFRQFVLAVPDRPGDLPRAPLPHVSLIREALAAYVQSLADLRQNLALWRGADPDARFAIYGASSTATGIVHLGGLDTGRMAYLVDGDPRKHGMVLPGTNARVWGPDHLAAEPVPYVIIASDFFQAEIEAILRDRFRSHVRHIVVCHPRFAITEIGSPR